MTRQQLKKPGRTQYSKRRSGFAMIVCAVLLMAMTLMALSTIDVVGRDQTVAGYQSRKSMSLYAAEAGLAEVLRTLEATGTPDLTAGVLGDTTIFPHGQPSYALDSTVANPVEDLGTAGISGQTANVGGTNYELHLFRVRVEGLAPGTIATRIEVALGVVVSNTSQ
ncbi:MAG: hypothetical protein IH881_16590 [Myxococcales bacterium]|nr:hypothetical protein [Myxococcales bacterium]